MRRKRPTNKPKEIPLSIERPAIDTYGQVSYSEGVKAWNIIRLKAEFIQHLPKLMERRIDVQYKITHYFSYEVLMKVIQEMKEKREPLPMLLFLKEMKQDFE